MKLPFSLLAFLSCLNLTSNAAAFSEQQFVCALKTEVKVLDPSEAIPQTQVKSIDQKYVFTVIGNKGSYINLYYPDIRGPLTIVSDGLKLTLIERNTSDNLFIATIFSGKELGDLHPIIFSLHIDRAQPTQSFGTCH